MDVVIAEDVAGWRNLIAGVVRNECFPDKKKLKIHTAANGEEARGIVESLRAEKREPFVLTDLHMPGGNGHEFVLKLDETGRPNLAIVSGTVSSERRKAIGHGTELPIISKDALLPGADLTARRIAVARIQSLAKMRAPKGRLMPHEVEQLKALSDPKFAPEKAALLADEAKGRFAELVQKYPEILTDDRLVSIIPKDLRGEQVSLKLHDYKNELGLAIATLAEHADVSKGLIADLVVFQSWLNQSYIELSRQTQMCYVSEVVTGIVSRLNQISDDRIVLRIDDSTLAVKISPSIVSDIISGLIQNALVHGAEPVHVRVGEHDDVKIINDLPQGERLPFSIFSGELETGQLPEKSSSHSGSGTGLKKILAGLQRHRESIRFYMSQSEGGAVEAKIRFESECIVRQEASAGSTHTTPRGVAIKTSRPNILFLCHEGTPRSTFGGLERFSMEGIRYEYITDVPRSYDTGGAPKKEAEFLAMMKRNRDRFNSATLCVLHTGINGLLTVIPALHRRFPRLVLLPTSSDPKALCDRSTGIFKLYRSLQDKIVPMVLTMEKVRRFHRVSDPATVGEIANEIYVNEVNNKRNVWESIVLIANRMAAGERK